MTKVYEQYDKVLDQLIHSRLVATTILELSAPDSQEYEKAQEAKLDFEALITNLKFIMRKNEK